MLLLPLLMLLPPLLLFLLSLPFLPWLLLLLFLLPLLLPASALRPTGVVGNRVGEALRPDRSLPLKWLSFG